MYEHYAHFRKIYGYPTSRVEAIGERHVWVSKQTGLKHHQKVLNAARQRKSRVSHQPKTQSALKCYEANMANAI
jgi:hypothetical protein